MDCNQPFAILQLNNSEQAEPLLFPQFVHPSFICSHCANRACERAFTHQKASCCRAAG